LGSASLDTESPLGSELSHSGPEALPGPAVTARKTRVLLLLHELSRTGAPGPDCAANYGEEDYRRHRQWRYSDHDLPHARHRLFHSLYQRLQALSPDERDRALRQLRETVGVAPKARPEYRVMTREELVRLAHGSLIDVGGHTTHHPLLPALPGPAQRREILGCKSWLEETLERRIENFSYPHGGFTTETREYIREAGFSIACSTRAAVVLGRDDPFALPRVVPESGGGDGFSRFLHAWFSGEPCRACPATHTTPNMNRRPRG